MGFTNDLVAADKTFTWLHQTDDFGSRNETSKTLTMSCFCVVLLRENMISPLAKQSKAIHYFHGEFSKPNYHKL